MAADAFSDVSDAYDAMINWRNRLSSEEPLYRWLFKRTGAKRILDAACGTGHHAAMFHSWGLEVEAADISPTMVERCRATYGESSSLRWVVRSFDQPVDSPGAFDVAICVGNSLALAGNRQAVDLAIGHLMDAVGPGGTIVVQVANLWRLPDGICQWQKCVRRQIRGIDSLIIKGIHRAGDRGFVDMLVTDLSGPTLQSECVPFLGLREDELLAAVRSRGATWFEVYGNYAQEPYSPQNSPDLIVVAGR